MEGTLTGPGGRGMQAVVITGIWQAMRSGSLVGVNTSRELRFGRAVHQLFDMNGPVIAERGCGWWQPSMGELSRGVCFNRLSDEHRQKIRESVVTAELNHKVWEDWRKEYVSTWYPYAFNREEPTDLETVKKVITAAADKIKEVEVMESFEAINVVPKGADKGSGLQQACQELAIPLEAVGYVGDSWSDWPALAMVIASGGRGVMMGKDKELRQQLEHMGGETLRDGSAGLAKWLSEEFSE